MPTNERNSWDRANNQGENHADFNRTTPKGEYAKVKQESADLHRNDAVNPIETQDDETSLDDDDKPDFLAYGTSDDDMHF